MTKTNLIITPPATLTHVYDLQPVDASDLQSGGATAGAGVTGRGGFLWGG
jgi:hypothetical protein